MNGKLFSKWLNEAVEAKGWKTANLAAELCRPYVTVRRWMTGKSIPKPDVMRKVCHLLNADPRHVLNEASEYQQFAFLSLELLQAKYAQIRGTQAMTAYEIVNVTAAHCYNVALREGLAAELTLDSRGVAIIHPIDASGAGLVIKLLGNNSELRVEVWPAMIDEDSTYVTSEQLNDMSFLRAIKALIQ